MTLHARRRAIGGALAAMLLAVFLRSGLGRFGFEVCRDLAVRAELDRR